MESEFWNQVQDAGFRRLIDQRRGQHDIEIPSRDLGPAVRQLIADDSASGRVLVLTGGEGLRVLGAG